MPLSGRRKVTGASSFAGGGRLHLNCRCLKTKDIELIPGISIPERTPETQQGPTRKASQRYRPAGAIAASSIQMFTVEQHPDFEVLSSIGYGAHSRLIKARCRRTGDCVALKCCAVVEPTSSRLQPSRVSAIRELGVLELLNKEPKCKNVGLKFILIPINVSVTDRSTPGFLFDHVESGAGSGVLSLRFSSLDSIDIEFQPTI